MPRVAYSVHLSAAVLPHPRGVGGQSQCTTCQQLLLPPIVYLSLSPSLSLSLPLSPSRSPSSSRSLPLSLSICSCKGCIDDAARCQGRTLIYWEEIFNNNVTLPKNTIIQGGCNCTTVRPPFLAASSLCLRLAVSSLCLYLAVVC